MRASKHLPSMRTKNFEKVGAVAGVEFHLFIVPTLCFGR